MTKIYLSPSDQTDNVYACGGTTEAEQCRKIANACEVALKRCGFDVKNGRSGSYQTRTAESNSWDADLHLAIHSNAFNGVVTGTRMFYYSEGGESYRACKAIYNVLAPLTPGTSDNMQMNQDLYEMYGTRCASVYIETDFHDNVSESQWIVAHTKEIGEAIAKGVCNFYGVTYKSGTSGTGSDSMYQVVTGSFKVRENAEKRVKALKDVGFDSFIQVK